MDDVDLYKQKYNDVIKKLEKLYKPKVIEVAECYKFHCKKQSKESVQDFVTSLKKLEILNQNCEESICLLVRKSSYTSTSSRN